MRKIRSFLQGFFGSKPYNASITAVILLNCAVLGLETTAFGKGEYKNALKITDELCLAIFSIELALRIFAFKLAFFTGKDRGWNAFDFIIVAVSLFGRVVQACYEHYACFVRCGFCLCCHKCAL